VIESDFITGQGKDWNSVDPGSHH